MFLKPDSEDNNEVFTDLKKIIEEILKTIAVLEPPLGG
jgi:hypothetical protein